MKTAVKEKPILMSAPMVRAIIDGRKSQTRRIAKLNETLLRDKYPDVKVAAIEAALKISPYQVGMRLWVREAWRPYWCHELYACVNYRADDGFQKPKISDEGCGHRFVDMCDVSKNANEPWRPSIHMPRWASRLTLEITEVRVERIQDISEEDAIAEGLEEFFWDKSAAELPQIKPKIDAGQRWWNHVIKKRWRNGSVWDCPIKAYRELWNDINGAGAWERNDWVFAIAFKVLS